MSFTPNKEILEKIRLFLAKKTGIKNAAERAHCSENMIYKALKVDTYKPYHVGIIIACLEVIKAAAEERIKFVEEKLKEIEDEDEKKTVRV